MTVTLMVVEGADAPALLRLTSASRVEVLVDLELAAHLSGPARCSDSRAELEPQVVTRLAADGMEVVRLHAP